MDTVDRLRSLRSPVAPRPAGTCWRLEPMEARQLLSAAGNVRSVDGTGNNLAHPDWGATGQDLLRQAAAAYADAVAAPAGASRPSARLVSNTVSTNTLGANGLNDRSLSAFVYAWGQFIDHDLDLTGSASPAQAFNVLVPKGDPSFDPAGTGTQAISLNRSEFDPATGTGANNPRQQVNDITSWIDGSVVYGSDSARAAALRTFVGGKLKTSAGNLMPLNTAGLANANDAHLVPNDQLFLGGDVRANENVELTALQTLFVREHNRLADSLAKANPSMNDEQIYQLARKTVVAEIESITYNEFLPALLGRGAIAPYRGYNPSVNPDVKNEFSTAAFRLGHSMLGDDVQFLDNNGNDVRDALSLANAFFNPQVVKDTGIDPILKYLASDNAQEVDTQVVDGVRNFLFGPPGAGGLDLVSLNIQRGRDHGLADYNTTRAAYGLPRVRSFAQITSDVTLQQKLKSLYGTVDNIDLWVGGLAEDHVAGASVGPLIRRILADQFQRVRDGDRFWYQATLRGGQLSAIENTSLADVIRRNTTLTNLQADVFTFDVTITGRVFNSGASRTSPSRQSLAGFTIQLQDPDGNVLQTTTSRADGSYAFSGLALGTYRVREVAKAGWQQTTADPADVQANKGMTISKVNFGNVRVASSSSVAAAVPSPFTAARIRHDDLLSDAGDVLAA